MENALNSAAAGVKKKLYIINRMKLVFASFFFTLLQGIESQQKMNSFFVFLCKSDDFITRIGYTSKEKRV